MRETRRSHTDDTTRRQAPQVTFLVLNRVVDFVFPDTVLYHEDVVTASEEAQRTLTVLYRKAAVKKVGIGGKMETLVGND